MENEKQTPVTSPGYEAGYNDCRRNMANTLNAQEKYIKDLERKLAMKYTFEDYRRALEWAGPKLTEIILDRAAHDEALCLPELTELVCIAYPEDRLSGIGI